MALLRLEHCNANRHGQPRVTAARPIEAAGRLKRGIREAADGISNETREDLEPRRNRDAANDAERRFMPTSGRARRAKRPELAYDPNLSVRKEGGVGKGASGAPLAIKARARIDDGRRACGRDPHGAAGASGGLSSYLTLAAHRSAFLWRFMVFLLGSTRSWPTRLILGPPRTQERPACRRAPAASGTPSEVDEERPHLGLTQLGGGAAVIGREGPNAPQIRDARALTPAPQPHDPPPSGHEARPSSSAPGKSGRGERRKSARPRRRSPSVPSAARRPRDHTTGRGASKSVLPRSG